MIKNEIIYNYFNLFIYNFSYFKKYDKYYTVVKIVN